MKSNTEKEVLVHYFAVDDYIAYIITDADVRKVNGDPKGNSTGF